jgi:hypothetical protein
VHARRKLDDDVALLLLEATAPPALPGLEPDHHPGADLALAWT